MSNNHNHSRLEEGHDVLLDFEKLSAIAKTGQSVIPVVVQDAHSHEVLILAYANQEALQYTIDHGIATFWSTSRNQLWIKGQESGNTLSIVDIRVNCEQNSLLYLVEIRGKGSCHTLDSSGTHRLTCYYRSIDQEGRLAFREGMK